MATVQHLRFQLIDPGAGGGLLPGQERGWTFAETAFFKDKAVVVTVQPNEFNNLDRTIEVTSRFHTTAAAAPSQQLQFTVKNVGVDPILIYFLLLGTIEA